MKLYYLIKIILATVSIIITCACTSSNTRNQTTFLYLENKLSKISNIWKQDSCGCDNKRKHILDTKQLLCDSLIGIPVSFIQQYLGAPNATYKKKDETILYYCVTCKYAPAVIDEPQTIKRMNMDAQILHISFNFEGMITNCGMMVP